MQKHSAALFFLFFLSLSIHCAEKKIIFGGDKGWPEFLRTQNITKTKGRFGKEAVSIANAAAALEPDTDLLLNFENADFSDRAGNYKLLSCALVSWPDSIMGKYAALGKGANKGLELKGSPQSIFGRSGSMGSFTVSFWLNPSLAENGETVFSWRSSRNIEGVPVYQMIAAAFFNNKIEWSFNNVFASSHTVKNITLSAQNIIIPNTWAFHSLSFDEETGLLEYCVNGKTESIIHATSTSRASGTVFLPILGVPAEIEICPAFTGKIDDFCIQKSSVRFDYAQPLFKKEGGYFETKPIGPFLPGTVVRRISAITDTPSETDVQFFIRSGNNYHTWTSSFPEWVPVKTGEKIPNVSGRWFQIAASLYTDGSGTKTPTLTELTFAYEEKAPPLPPVQVFANPGDSCVDLFWHASTGTDISGYILYYGESPGEYLGQTAVEGRSPIDTGNKRSFRISGLKNGKIYYFAVAAYEDAGIRLEGPLSDEIYARPLKGIP
ncbi:fibronectin type III domain-containing protein [Treponema sp. OMZ 840]